MKTVKKSFVSSIVKWAEIVKNTEFEEVDYNVEAQTPVKFEFVKIKDRGQAEKLLSKMYPEKQIAIFDIEHLTDTYEMDEVKFLSEATLVESDGK